MRLFILAIFTTLLAACGPVPNRLKDNELGRQDFSTICLEGVSYWVRVSGRTYMAPRYDKATLQPVRCSE